MNKVRLLILMICTNMALSDDLFAQQKKAVSFQDLVKKQNEVNTSVSHYKRSTDYTLFAGFNQAIANPNSLNEYREQLLWNNTTPSNGKFNNLAGFSIGFNRVFDHSMFGIEYSHLSQKLGLTSISSTNNEVRDAFQIDKIYLTAAWRRQSKAVSSYEFGLALGYTTRYRFTQELNYTGASETLSWRNNTFAAQIRAAYSYHFSEHVRLRTALGYEYLAPVPLKAESASQLTTINGQNVSEGQVLTDSQGRDIKPDLSGLRLQAQLVIGF